MADFIRAGAGRSEGMIFLSLWKKKGEFLPFLRPALSRVSAEKTRFPLFAEKGIVVS
ncbi:MAG: hypothetical protein ACLT8C_07145 [Akkermansia muciniphila]